MGGAGPLINASKIVPAIIWRCEGFAPYFRNRCSRNRGHTTVGEVARLKTSPDRVYDQEAAGFIFCERETV